MKSPGIVDVYAAAILEGEVQILVERVDGMLLEWRIPVALFAQYGVPWGRAPVRVEDDD